ncbi:hypothetical protein [Streptomyces sp. NPDC051183]|uniref:hypothetical protein n=1 Tax=unclassified Streptomyces TaxID=2593676 RepID=UPI003413FA94
MSLRTAAVTVAVLAAAVTAGATPYANHAPSAGTATVAQDGNFEHLDPQQQSIVGDLATN